MSSPVDWSGNTGVLPGGGDNHYIEDTRYVLLDSTSFMIIASYRPG
jgi:hypothetical protein